MCLLRFNCLKYFFTLEALLPLVSVLLQGCSQVLGMENEAYAFPIVTTTASHATRDFVSHRITRPTVPLTLWRLPRRFGATIDGQVAHETLPVSSSVPVFVSKVFAASTGERLQFIKDIHGQWEASLLSGRERRLSVFAKSSIDRLVSWLQGQDIYVSKSRIHVVQSVMLAGKSCVYLGKHGLLGGMPDASPDIDDALHQEALEQDRLDALMRQVSHERATQAQLIRDRDLLEQMYKNCVQNIALQSRNAVLEEQCQALSKDRAALQKECIAYSEDVAALQSRTDELSAEKEAMEQELSLMRQTRDKLVHVLASTETLLSSWKAYNMAFGKKSWERYFGEVGEEPRLPPDIDTIWHSSCPIWPLKKVNETHLLVMIPAHVSGSLFTLNLLGDLIRRANPAVRHSYDARFRLYNSRVRQQIGTVSPGSSYWVLVPRDVLPESLGKGNVHHQEMTSSLARKTQLGYTIPGALELSTAILVHHARSGERLYASTYACCLEQLDGPYPVTVGGFSSDGFHVHHTYQDFREDTGVTCIRKFFNERG